MLALAAIYFSTDCLHHYRDNRTSILYSCELLCMIHRFVMYCIVLALFVCANFFCFVG